MVFLPPFHLPVLCSEILSALRIQEGEKYIDATVGGGGYLVEILQKGGIVLGIDWDARAIAHTRALVQSKHPDFLERGKVILFRGNFREIESIAVGCGFSSVCGILFDLGMSSYHIDTSQRGFSFQKDEPLDMRMDERLEKTAADIIHHSTREELYEIFSRYSEEYYSRAISTAIFRARSMKPITTTQQLVRCIDDALRAAGGKHILLIGARERRKTFARIFQALRIAVNDELENLREGLRGAVSLLRPGGRLAVISYHSLEDRIVKTSFRAMAREHIGMRVVTSSPIRVADREVRENPRSRSAKLRVAEKI